jgi:hypothetical protein
MPEYQIVSTKYDGKRITKIGLLMPVPVPFPTRVAGQVYESIVFLFVEEAIDLLQANFRLYTVGRDGRRTEVSGYPRDNPTELRSDADNTTTDNLGSLVPFDRKVQKGTDEEDWVAIVMNPPRAR